MVKQRSSRLTLAPPTTLLFYTPTTNGTDFFPHLVEHCVLHNHQVVYEYFFRVTQLISATLKHGLYTQFICPYYSDYRKLLDLVMQDLTSESIRAEMKVLRSELDGSRNTVEALSDAIATAIWVPNHTNRRILCTYDDIRAYHRKRYQQAPWSLIDVYANLLRSPITKHFSWKIQFTPTSVKYGQFLGKWYKYNVIYTPLNNIANIAVFELLEHVCTAWKLYEYRYRKSEYHYDDTDVSYSAGHMYIANPYQWANDFDEDFFQMAKEDFLEHDWLDGGRKFLRVREIAHQQLLDDKQLYQYLKTITYQQIKPLQALLAPRKK